MGILSRVDASDFAARCVGSLLGAAIGDALGMPFDGLTREEIVRAGGCHRFEPARETRSFTVPLGGIADAEEGELLRAGQWTSNTQLTLALAEMLLDEGGTFVPEAWGHWLVRWVSQEPRLPDLSTLQAALQLRTAAVEWNESADPEGASAAAAARLAPIGLLYSDARLRSDAAATQAAVTHGDPDAVAAAVAVAEALAIAVEALPSEAQAILPAVAERTAAGAPTYAEMARCLRIAANLLTEDADPAAVIRALGTSSWSREAVPTALYIASRFGAQPEEALTAATNLTGSAVCQIASIVGAVTGALCGADALPAELRAGVEEGSRIAALGDRLARVQQVTPQHPSRRLRPISTL